jgi:anaerobic magnesium-protoporphyrin IX monomethyl ester cyclase
LIILVNPKSAKHSFRVPNSLLTLGAFLEGKHEYNIVDENYTDDIISELKSIMSDRKIKYLGLTVMPGLQLRRAVFISGEIKKSFPGLTIIWGGYFPSLHPNTVLKSGYVDFVLRGHSEFSFVELIDALEGNSGISFDGIKGLSYKNNGNFLHNEKSDVINPDLIPRLPYHKVDVNMYLKSAKTYLGGRTIAYHSSVGCPFLCGFCAVAGIYKGRWAGRDAKLVADDLEYLKYEYNIGAVEFHDNNFFVSEKRCYEISEKIRHLNIGWWGEARPDTVMKFSDETLTMMKNAGCRMIFFGAESGSEEILKLMHKGGTQDSKTVPALADRLKKFGIVPEFSFVLGNPTEHVFQDIKKDIKYIRGVKKVNPDSEIIIYTYSPVNFEDSEMSLASKMKGFDYPKSLEEWVSPRWQNFDLRKNPLTPWMKPGYFNFIRNFEKTLNARYPTKSDLKIKGWKKAFLKTLSFFRYKFAFYAFPYEIIAALKLLKYRQPEIEGFPYSGNHSVYSKALITVRRIYFIIVYNLIYKKKISRISEEKIDNMIFTVPASVFNPKSYKSSEIFSKFIKNNLDLNQKNVLDMGCGSGILSVFAASKGAACLAVDKNPESVLYTEKNAIRNNYKKQIETVESDLFNNLKNGYNFDVILFNPPYYKGVPENNFEMAFKGGENYEVMESFFSGSGRYLNKNGKIFMIYSTDIDKSIIDNMIRKNHYQSKIAFKKKMLFETFYIEEISMSQAQENKI